MRNSVHANSGWRLNVDDKKYILKLNKALYGLKQAGRQWNQKFDSFIKQLGFVQSQADKRIYTGFFEGIKVYLALYVEMACY